MSRGRSGISQEKVDLGEEIKKSEMGGEYFKYGGA
jgi:hypothetical protein